MDKEVNNFLLTGKSRKNGEEYRENMEWLKETNLVNVLGVEEDG